MAYAVVLSEPAEADLVDIVDFIARENPAAAFRLGRELLEKAGALKNFPRTGPELRRRKARYTVRGRYRIFYRINEEAKVVEILRFWHGARNPRSLRFS